MTVNAAILNAIAVTKLERQLFHVLLNYSADLLVF